MTIMRNRYVNIHFCVYEFKTTILIKTRGNRMRKEGIKGEFRLKMGYIKKSLWKLVEGTRFAQDVVK